MRSKLKLYEQITGTLVGVEFDSFRIHSCAIKPVVGDMCNLKLEAYPFGIKWRLGRIPPPDRQIHLSMPLRILSDMHSITVSFGLEGSDFLDALLSWSTESVLNLTSPNLILRELAKQLT